MTTSLPNTRTDKLTPVVTLCLIFLCGALVGAVTMSLVGHGRWHPPTSTPTPSNPGQQLSVADWKKQLDLTDDQTARLTTLLKDFSRYYDDMLADGNTRILELLNESQKKKFRKMMEERKGK